MGAVATADRHGTPNAAMQFDGTSAYIRVPSPGLPIGATARTLTAWIKYSGPGGAPTGGIATAIVHWGNEDCTGKMFGFGQQSDRLFLWGGCADLSTALPIPRDQWIFVAITYDGTRGTAWLNEKKESFAVDLATTESDLWIGVETVTNSPPFRWFFNGAIDDVRVYSVALSDADLAALRAE